MFSKESVEALTSYLQDHLAGSVTGVELAHRIVDENQDNPLGSAFAPLVPEIEKDQRQLQEIISRFDASDHPLKKGFAWITEKFLGLKFIGDEKQQYELNRLEQLEAMFLGVRGKRSLWEMLAEIAPQAERLADIDFRELADRARQQCETIESLRLQAGRQMAGAALH